MSRASWLLVYSLLFWSFLLLGRCSADKLEQTVTFFRHGAHTEKTLLTSNEYEQYGLPDDCFNMMTPLGNSQAWSYGYSFKQSHQEFLQGLDFSKDVQFVIGDFEKSFENSQSLFLGLLGESLGWKSSEMDRDFVRAVISKNGVCKGCSSLSHVSIGKSFERSPENVQELIQNMQMTVLEDDWLLDPDSLCENLKSYSAFLTILFYNRIIGSDPETKAQFASFAQSLPSELELKDYIGNHFHTYLYSVYYFHSLHGLTMPKELFEDYPKVAELIKDPKGYEDFQKNFYAKLFKKDMGMAKIFSSELIRRVLHALDKKTPKMLVYLVHDNNLGALSFLLFGYEKVLENYEEFFVHAGSSIRLEIWSKGTSKYVNVFRDERLMISQASFQEFFQSLTEDQVDVTRQCDLLGEFTERNVETLQEQEANGGEGNRGSFIKGKETQSQKAQFVMGSS